MALSGDLCPLMAMDSQVNELRILHLEDVATDADLVAKSLAREGMAYKSLWVATEPEFKRALQNFAPNLVLCDYHMPTYNGRDALEFTVRNYPHIPVIILTGALGDEQAVDLLKLGARDYVLKENLSRLPMIIRHVLHDEQEIIKRKQVEDKLKLFRALLDQSDDAIEIIDPATSCFIDVNEGACRELGYSREELLSMKVHDIDPEFAKNPEKIQEVLKKTGQARVETIHQRKDGSILPVEVNIKRIELDKPYGLAITRNITARKQAEQERLKLLLDSKRNTSQLETIFATQKDVILLYDLDMKVCRSTPQFKNEYGFDPVGAHVSDIMRGVSCRNLDGQPVTFDENQPTPSALNGEGVNAVPFKVTRSGGAEAIVEVYSRPFYVDGDIHGAVTVWRDITELKKAADDIAAYALQLEGAIWGTLTAISSMVEQRDPYTAGHERRVGIIAADIAGEMGWSEQKCKELEMIGLVHDIGKIGLPAEILSKPSKLSVLEYEIVKAHAEKGYEVLKGVEFPMPVAEIIRQHHERMNGSGYPRGLKGEQILPEARVLAVADVLESMASHRPYRPALGMDAALDELMKNRGTLYDPDVVDALLRLVRGKGYRLPD